MNDQNTNEEAIEQELEELLGGDLGDEQAPGEPGSESPAGCGAAAEPSDETPADEDDEESDDDDDASCGSKSAACAGA